MATQTSRSMISETSICNQALAWLGAEHIDSLEDPTEAAQYCRDNYPFLRDTVLESRMWTFAKARQKSTVSDRDEFDEYYLHTMPQDWLQVFHVWQTADGQEVEWSREGRNILAKTDIVYMVGIKRVTDTGFFSNLFVQALAARMAADLAIPLTENRALQSDMWNLYSLKMDEAAARDGQQGRNQKIISNSLIDARRRR